MSAKKSTYWPVFLIVAALSTAAVWKFAPVAPIPDDCRAWCVKTVKSVLKGRARNEPKGTGTVKEDIRRPTADGRMSAETPTSAPATAQKNDPAGRQSLDTPQSAGRSPRERRPGGAASSSPAPAARPVAAAAQTKVEELAQAEEADDALAMTPAQRKKKYDELTKKAEARRLQVLRENLTKSAEGRKALAAVKAFKEFAAKVDALKKQYGETDSRVVSKRGDILKLKDDVRRTNDAYKKWKEKHPDQFVVPEADEEYRKIIGERQLYAD